MHTDFFFLLVRLICLVSANIVWQQPEKKNPQNRNTNEIDLLACNSSSNPHRRSVCKYYCLQHVVGRQMTFLAIAPQLRSPRQNPLSPWAPRKGVASHRHRDDINPSDSQEGAALPPKTPTAMPTQATRDWSSRPEGGNVTCPPAAWSACGNDKK